MSGNDDFRKKLNFDAKVYPVEAILGTAYKYLDNVYTRLEFANGDKTVKVSVHALSDAFFKGLDRFFDYLFSNKEKVLAAEKGLVITGDEVGIYGPLPSVTEQNNSAR